jgi:hypothetical protein
MKNRFGNSVAMLAALAALAAADTALACPMCKAAAESDPRLPNAFMASILFMLAMPFTIATCFGVAFYRLSRKMPAQPFDRAAPRPPESDTTAQDAPNAP